MAVRSTFSHLNFQNCFPDTDLDAVVGTDESVVAVDDVAVVESYDFAVAVVESYDFAVAGCICLAADTDAAAVAVAVGYA